MGSYKYSVVPFIGSIKVGFFSSESATNVSTQLEELINAKAADGWEFYRIDHVTVHVKGGCMSGLSAKGQVQAVVFDQVIFRRPVD